MIINYRRETSKKSYHYKQKESKQLAVMTYGHENKSVNYRQ